MRACALKHTNANYTIEHAGETVALGQTFDEIKRSIVIT
jgi:hypothetical protein